MRRNCWRKELWKMVKRNEHARAKLATYTILFTVKLLNSWTAPTYGECPLHTDNHDSHDYKTITWPVIWLFHNNCNKSHMTVTWQSHITLTLGSYSCSYRNSATWYPEWVEWCLGRHWKILLRESFSTIWSTLVLLLQTPSGKDAECRNERLESPIDELLSTWLH